MNNVYSPRLLMAERFVLMKLVNLVEDLVVSEVLVAGDFLEVAEEEVGFLFCFFFLNMMCFLFISLLFQMSFNHSFNPRGWWIWR